MRFGFSTAASALILGAASANAGVMPLDAAAKLFGARPSAFAPDLSPNGDKIVYLAAGPGASTAVLVEDVKANTDKLLVKSSGKPEQLEWCDFADERWVVCRFGGWVKELGLIFRVARTVAIDTASGTIRPLGAPEHSDDEGFSQFDGEIIDWLPDAQGALLMQRRAGQHRAPGRAQPKNSSAVS